MRDKLLLILILFLTSNSVSAQSPPYWFHFAGNAGYDEGTAITTDNAGGIINVGYFSSFISFDGLYLFSNGVTDGYIVKTANDGTYQWALNFGGSSDDRALGVCTDSQNNCYVTGYFSGTAKFGNFTLNSLGQQDVFILKVDASGTILWVTQGGGNGNDIGNGICDDHNGGIIVTGQFRDTAQFGTATFMSMPDPLTTIPSTDIFTAKLNNSGTFIWAKQGAGKYTDRGIEVSCDLNGNAYVTGQFSDTIQFDIIHNNNLYNAIFLIKYDASGNEQWFNKIGAGSISLVRSIKVDLNADFYVSGECGQNTIFFGTPNITISNPYPTRVFVAKYNSSGAVQWANALGSTNTLTAGDMAIDDSSNVYVIGNFQCKMNELSTLYGDGTFNSVGYKDVYTARFSSTGVLEWGRQCGGPADDAGNGIALTGNTPVITGSYNNRFIYTTSGSYVHYEDATISNPISANTDTFCLDLNIDDFSQIPSNGVADIFFGKAFDLTRGPFDYYNRNNNTNCLRPYVGVCINTSGADNSCSPDSISACGSISLYAASNTSGSTVNDTLNSPGPTFQYLWSTGESTPDITVITSGNYWVRLTSIDGCFISYDTIHVTLFANPFPPLISDNHFINTLALVTTKIKVCAPDTIILSATNIYNYAVQWNVGNNTINDSVYTYYANGDDSVQAVVTITDANNCSSQNYITLVVDSALPPIAPRISTSQDSISLCDGGSYQMQIHINDSIADPNDTHYCDIPYANFTWTSVPALNIFNICNNGQVATTLIYQPGNYLVTCTIIRASPCGGNDTIVLIKNIIIQYYPPIILTPPTLSLSGSDTICPNDSVTITASGGLIFKWNGPNIPFNTVGSQLTVYTAGTYCATVFDTSANGCVTTAVSCQTIYGTPIPQIYSIPGSNVICPGDSVQLLTAFSGNYQWLGPQGTFGGNNSAVYANLPGFYHCDIISGGGCVVSSNTLELVQYTTPIIIATPSNVICRGDSVQVQVVASPSSNVFWYSPFNSASWAQYVDSGGTYVCFIESCNIIQEDSITIYESTVHATITPDGSIDRCMNDSISLTANAGMSNYEWYPGNIPSQMIYASIAGNYFVIVTDAYGCSDTSAIVTINDLATPSTPVITANSPLCEGDSILFSTGFQSGVSYNWTGPGNYVAQLQNPFIANAQLNNSGLYILLLNNAQCPSLPDSIIVQVDSFPPAFTINGNLTICEGESFTLNTNPSFPNQGTWTLPSNQTSLGSVFSVNNAILNNSGQYIFSISNQQCERKDSTTVQVNALPPVFQLMGPQPVCEGDTISLSTNPDLGSQGIWTLPDGQIYLGANLNLLTSTISNNGIYTFSINNQQCNRSDSILVTVNTYPSAFGITGNTQLCEGDLLNLTTTPDFGTQGTWTIPDNTIYNGATYNLAHVDSSTAGIYYYAISNQNCSRTDSVNIVIVSCGSGFPNVFTPNTDGIHDIFNSINSDLNVQWIKIFNRWGDQIYESKGRKGWDGKNNDGDEAPSGTYFYIAGYLDGPTQKLQTAKGYLELIR